MPACPKARWLPVSSLSSRREAIYSQLNAVARLPSPSMATLLMPRYGLEADTNRPGSGRRCAGCSHPRPALPSPTPAAAAAVAEAVAAGARMRRGETGPGEQRGWIQHGGAEPEPRVRRRGGGRGEGESSGTGRGRAGPRRAWGWNMVQWPSACLVLIGIRFNFQYCVNKAWWQTPAMPGLRR